MQVSFCTVCITSAFAWLNRDTLTWIFIGSKETPKVREGVFVDSSFSFQMSSCNSYRWRTSFSLIKKCNYSPIYASNWLFSSMEWQVTGDNCRSRPCAGGLALSLRLWQPSAPGRMCCSWWWELKTVLLTKSTPACRGSGSLPRSNHTRAALFISPVTEWFLPSATGSQQASSSLSVSEIERWMRCSDTPEIHFKQTIRACWHMGLIGFYEYA